MYATTFLNPDLWLLFEPQKRRDRLSFEFMFYVVLLLKE